MRVESKGGKCPSLQCIRSPHPNSVGRVCPVKSLDLAQRPRQHWCPGRASVSMIAAVETRSSPAACRLFWSLREIQNLLFCSSLLHSNYIYLYRRWSEGEVRDVSGARCLGLLLISKWKMRINPFISQGNQCGSIGMLLAKVPWSNTFFTMYRLPTVVTACWKAHFLDFHVSLCWLWIKRRKKAINLQKL